MATAPSLDPVIAHLDYLRAPGEPLYRWRGGGRAQDGTIQMPWVNYSDRVSRLISEFYACGLILAEFNWPDWQEEAVKYAADDRLLKSADIKTCAKLLTVHVRKERFCEGHLTSILDDGHLANIVERLKELRNGPPDDY